MTITELHTKAIEIANEAFILKASGNVIKSFEQFEIAYNFDSEAALAAYTDNIGEPSISILHRSAASLAMNCNKYSEAEKLICFALRGDPPFEIAEELRDLLEQVYFERHLQLKGVKLEANELQIVFAGNAVGSGMSRADDVLYRLNIIEKINNKTIERRAGLPYKDYSNLPKNLKPFYNTYYSVPRSASFALTIRIGEPSNQMSIPGMNNANQIDIIDEIIENISLVNEGKYDALKEKIPEDAYYKNFIALSKELAPDGEDVNLVGFTIVREGKEKKVQFTTKRREIKLNKPVIDSNQLSIVGKRNQDKSIEVVGILDEADNSKKKMRLITDNGELNVKVPDGLGEIVKKYWGEKVVITGIKKGKTIELEEINYP